MAKLECHFFPEAPASWICNHCGTQYSEKCIPTGRNRHRGRAESVCIRCGGDLKFLGSATGAKPFWQMLPHFFAYPLHLNSLLVIILVAGLSLLFGRNLMTVFLALFAAAVVVKYSFAIIEQRGSGKITPPVMTAVISGDEDHLFLRQIALFFLMGVIAGMTAYLNELLGVLVGGFLTLAVPASIMLLAVDKSVSRALNPLALSSLMLAVGWPYLLLWFCVQIISAGPVYIFGWMAAVLPVSAIAPILASLMVYFTFVLYAMLGYVLFEYQSELGFESVAEEDEDTDDQGFEKARALGESTVLIMDAEYERARECLRSAMERVHDDIDLHLRYHKLLMLLNDDEALVNHCDYLINILKQRNMLGKGVPVVLDVQSRIAAFRLADTQAAMEVAHLFQLQGKHKAVVRLFRNMHKTNARDPLLPEAYLMVATILFEYLNEDAKALSIIHFVLTKYPDCPQTPQFEKLQSSINQNLKSVG